MANMTTPFPVFDGETVEDNFRELQEWAICLTDELKYLFCNLDAGNVMEASRVRARNIDCSRGRIKDWQMQSLTADKITAGTIDAQEITVINIDADNINTGVLNSELVNVGNSDSYGTVTLTGDSLMFYEKVKENGATKKALRIALGRDEENNYIFTVQNRDATQGVYMDDNGDIVISGTIRGGKIESDTDINVTKDASVGKYLRVGYVSSRVDSNGIPQYTWTEESGIMLSGLATIKTTNSGNNIVLTCMGGIELDSDLVMIKKERVLTAKDLDSINIQLKELWEAINAK